MDLPRIAIASLNRQNLIGNLTLRYLFEQEYPSELIDIFVANLDQMAEYMMYLPRHLYCRIIVGSLGLANQRNFISKYYPENEIYVSMDDDVKRLVFMQPSMSFCGFIRFCVQQIQTKETGLVGVLPNTDGRKMKSKITEHLTHILGSFFVIRNHKDIEITTNEKEDYERSIKYFLRYGKVFRYCMAGVDTDYAKTPGGLQTPGRIDRMRLEVEHLLTIYPDMLKIRIKKDMPDIELNWRYKISNPVTDAPETLESRG